jgi:multidrug resistance efflux pump
LGQQLKLRSDLVVSRQDTPEGTVVVVKAPVIGRFFRLREIEHFIAQHLDGSTPFDVLRRRAEEKFGAPLPQATLEQFIEKLRRLGLLETEDAQPVQQTSRRGRIRGNFLYLRFKAFDPDRLFDRLIRKVSFFFTSYFMAFSVGAILLAFLVTLSNWGQIGRDLLGLYRLDTLLLAWLTILCVTTAHELAHGLTCKHYGGEVHEMGFMLLFFMPAFYCNVSDTWLFPERSKRLWVTFAGAYFEIFLWGLATLIWRVTEPATWINSVALVVMATSGIKTFFNFNPLIKLDGYYLLSDYLEIPNLRQRALSYLKETIQRLGGKVMQGIQEITPRQRRIYLIYGLLTGIYSFLVLGLISLRFGGFLIGQYQGLGFLLSGVLMMTLFQNPLKKICSKPPVLKETITLMRGRPAKITVLAVVLAVLLLGRMELRVSGEFKVLPVHNADIRAEVEGRIEEIYLNEGDQVKEGDLIARLSDRDYRAELEKIEAEMDGKRANLKMLKAGPRPEEIELVRMEVETARTRQEHALRRYQEAEQIHAEGLSGSRSRVAKAKERLSYAGSYLKTFQELLEAKVISRLEIERAEEQVAVREKELEEARAELEIVLANDLAEFKRELAVAEKESEETKGRLGLLQMGSRPEKIEANEAEIARLETQHNYLAQQLELVKVVSPSSGVITTPKLKEKIGQYMKKGDLIAEVHELKTIRGEIPISEKEIADVKIGQKVVLKARAFPEHSFYGQVRSIAPAAAKEDAFGGATILVMTELDNSSLLLKPEMTGNAKIYGGKRRIFNLMTRRLTRYIRVEFWSWW